MRGVSFLGVDREEGEPHELEKPPVRRLLFRDVGVREATKGLVPVDRESQNA